MFLPVPILPFCNLPDTFSVLIHPPMAVYSGSLAKGPAAGGSLDRWQPLLWAVPQAAEHVSIFLSYTG